jgi:hypothetical protein
MRFKARLGHPKIMKFDLTFLAMLPQRHREMSLKQAGAGLRQGQKIHSAIQFFALRGLCRVRFWPTPEETARAQRFRSAQDRNRYIAQHGVLRGCWQVICAAGPAKLISAAALTASLAWQVKMEKVRFPGNPYFNLRLPGNL